MDRAELDRRAEVLERLSVDGGPLTQRGATASIRNADFYGHSGLPTPTRRRVQRRIMKDYSDRFPEVESEGQAIVMAGPPGAGKSTALQSIIAATGIPQEKWMLLDADEVKKLLLDQACADGTFQSMVPPELHAEGIVPYPAELASLVHEESSLLVKALRSKAIQARMNIIIDGTLADYEKSDALLTTLAENGYTVYMASIDIPLVDSKTRIRSRWEHGITEAEKGHCPDGARWVPPAFAQSVFSPTDTQHSRCHANATTLAHKHSHVLRLICQDGTTGKITGDYQRNKPGAQLIERGRSEAPQPHLTDCPHPPATHRGPQVPGPGD